MSGFNNTWKRSPFESVWLRAQTRSHCDERVPLVALLRVRNEELILEDTLEHLATFADYICAYEDASIDSTREILKGHPKVALIIENDRWEPSIEGRLLAETSHRGLLLQETRAHFHYRWCMCCDADERYVGPIRDFVTAPDDGLPSAVRIQLFDAYMTPGDKTPYRKGTPLLNFRRYFGPERRDILMLWKDSDLVSFAGLDSREPKVSCEPETRFLCQHYGKSLSDEHWESTCDYYVSHFPWVPYGQKWATRKGKSVHQSSDFNRPLYEWGDDLFSSAVKIY